MCIREFCSRNREQHIAFTPSITAWPRYSSYEQFNYPLPALEGIAGYPDDMREIDVCAD